MSLSLKEQLQMRFPKSSLSGINQRSSNIPVPPPPEFEEAPTLTEEPVDTKESIEEVLNEPKPEITEEPQEAVIDQEVRMEQPTNKAPEVWSKKDFTSMRIDGKPDRVSNVKIKSVTNSALRRLKEIFKPAEGEEFEVDSTIDIDCKLIKNTNRVGIYEEGGSEYGKGYALTVCGPNGEKLQPSVVYTNDDFLNGLHALVPVTVNDLVLLGIRVPNDISIVVAYKITEFTSTSNEDPCAKAELQAAFFDGEVSLKEPDSDFDMNFETPVVKATFARLSEEFAVTPCWVQDWSVRPLNVHDFADCVNDKEFMDKLKDYDDLESAYDDVTSELRNRVKGLSKGQHCICSIALDINPKDAEGKDAIFCFISGVVYDTIARTSANNRLFYARVILHEGDEFFYIDNPTFKIPYAKLVEAMKKSVKPNGRYTVIGTTVWRMTI